MTTLLRLDLSTSWGPLTLVGGSRAGDGTLLLLPQLGLALDPGRPHRALPPMRHVFVSHGHLDHVGGLAYWASQRLLHGLGTGTVIAPPHLCPGLERLLELHAGLEGSPGYDVRFAAPADGEPHHFRRDMELVPFATGHWVPTAGVSLVWRRRKLRADLAGLPPEEIGRRKAAGEEIAREVAVALLGYGADGTLGTGETRAAVESAEVACLECTFFEPEERDRAARYGHLHLDDLIAWAPELACRHLVVLHASRRHKVADVRRLLDRHLRPRLSCELHDLIVDWD